MDQHLVLHSDLEKILCTEVLHGSRQYANVTCLMFVLASPTTYRRSGIVRKRISRSLSASIWANILIHKVLVRDEEYSVLLRKGLQFTYISLCFRNKLPETFFHRNDWWTFDWRCSFHGNCAFSLMICFLGALGSGTLVQNAQSRP